MNEELQVLDGVVFETHLRFVPQWGAAADRASREQLLESTLHVLEAVNALEEPMPERRLEDAPWHADFVRIDRRLNLLVVMVARLLARDEGEGVVLPVRLHSEGMAWRMPQEQNSAEIGMRLVCLVYLPSFPTLPVALPAEFAGPMPGKQGWVFARFDGLTDVVAEQLDRLIFRHHRRHVAGQRQSSGHSSD